MAESLAPPLHKDPGIQGRRHSHPPVRCRDLGSLSEADQATGAVSPSLLALHCRNQMARPRVERRSPQESQLAQHRAIFFSELQEGKHDRSAPRKSYKDQLKRQLAQAGISRQSRQQKASDRDSWRSSVRKSSLVQSAVGCVHQESVSTPTNEHASIDYQPSQKSSSARNELSSHVLQ